LNNNLKNWIFLLKRYQVSKKQSSRKKNTNNYFKFYSTSLSNYLFKTNRKQKGNEQLEKCEQVI